jgi:predicted AAA+ superfamily ATPase
MFTRSIESAIIERINSGKAIVVVGARQVGKTTLLNKILKDTDFLFLDADDPSVRNLLQSPTTEQIRQL